jgi:hypothetical protein
MSVLANSSRSEIENRRPPPGLRRHLTSPLSAAARSAPALTASRAAASPVPMRPTVLMSGLAYSSRSDIENRRKLGVRRHLTSPLSAAARSALTLIPSRAAASPVPMRPTVLMSGLAYSSRSEIENRRPLGVRRRFVSWASW